MFHVTKIMAWLIGTFLILPALMLYALYLTLVFWIVGWTAAAVVALIIAGLIPIVIYKSGDFIE